MKFNGVERIVSGVVANVASAKTVIDITRKIVDKIDDYKIKAVVGSVGFVVAVGVGYVAMNVTMKAMDVVEEVTSKER